MDPNSLPTSAEEYRSALVAEAEEQLAKLTAKAEKLAEQAASAAQHVKDKTAEVKAIKGGAHPEFRAPGSRATAEADVATGTGSAQP